MERKQETIVAEKVLREHGFAKVPNGMTIFKPGDGRPSTAHCNTEGSYD